MSDTTNLLHRLEAATTALCALCAIAPSNWDDPKDVPATDAWSAARAVLESEGFKNPLRPGEYEDTHFAGEYIHPAFEA